MRRSSNLVVLITLALLASELILRLAQPLLPTPLNWYSAWAEEKASRVEELEADMDVVFLGDSSTMAALDPNIFTATDRCQRTAFNGGIPVATPEMMADWYERVFAVKSPGWVVVGLTSRVLLDGDSAPYFDALAVRRDPMGVVTRAVADYSVLIRLRGSLRDPQRWISRHSAPQPNGPEQMDNWGWTPRPRATYQAFEEPRVDSALPNGQIQVLAAMASQLQRDGTHVTFAWLPITEDWYNNMPRGRPDWVDHGRQVAELAHMSGSDFIDLSDLNTKEFFIDPLHLNAKGAVEITTRLAGTMSQQCRE